ncbi:hypothetical protein [Leptospira kirschneri]|uniref:Uncharacterized protein n=1 Tax=Leptospira kirschneri str. H1 TaxID=1049966 RepID=A0A0E2B3N1_9LEPT|nr:hypothetical protein [Leptospira kirschneri]EKO15405.1 hypothetical protein LEP1GSC081_1262 [Leptospira kirschneri str. H1]EKO58915.1 hypothetical protein LEP1GSC082_2423 [Leptospira kirschneri str. H2]
MPEKKSPRLRNVEKVKAPYLINEFPNEFGFNLGREIVYLLATKGKPVLEGSDWEEMFANCVGAEWKPSNVGLDDVVLGNCCWGTKTVKANVPSKQKTIRLISGRNSPAYSFGESKIKEVEPNKLGEQILDIWNERVSSVREKFKHVRTVVLIKSNSLEEVVVFEYETLRYDPDLFSWKWNNNENLEGHLKSNEKHKFTWQPHGSQFTIVEEVPDDSLIINIKNPPKLDKETVLKGINFDKSWVKVKRRQ